MRGGLVSGDATPLMIAATIDVSDLEAATEFWLQLLDLEVAGIQEPYAFLNAAEGRKIAIWLQQVPEAKAGKNRCHLAFVAGDLEAAEQRVRDLGGSVGEQHTWQDFLWRTCQDPDGNEFDIMQAQNS